MSCDDRSQGDSGPQLPAPNKRQRKQPHQKNIDQFWEAFKTNNPGKIYTILPQNQRADKTKRESRDHVQNEPVFASYERARRECQAVVDKISKECRRVNQRYRDIHFDMEFDLKWGRRYCLEKLVPGGDDSQLYPKSVKRVGQIFDEPKFYIDGATASDIRQGRDGDCWFLSGLSACIQKPGWIEEVCVARDEKVGVYGFVFHRDGEWFFTVIDDRLYLSAADYDESYDEKLAMLQLNDPGNQEEAYRVFYQTGSKALYFAQCASDNETWLPLIEKAYAKAHGDYGAIDGGFTGEAIEDLTGGVTTELWSSDILDTDKFWEELLQVNKEFLFGCATGWSDDFMGAGWLTNRNDIHAGHAYSILEAREVQGQRLLKLRNPWGESEWKGAWSDGSAEWTPMWMELLNHRFGDDGIFWISYKDLLKKFSNFDRTRLFRGKDWKVTQKWTSVHVPWTTDYNDTKFQFEINESGRCILVLSQLDDRFFQGLEGQYYFSLQFRVEKDSEEGYIVRSNTTYFMNRSCSVELDLEPGTYSVIMKIDAQRIPTREDPEQVVRRLYKEKRDKLLQVGAAYDYAHAKALPLETEDDKAYRKAQEKKEEVKEKQRTRKALRYQKRKIWEKRIKDYERKTRQKARLQEHRRKKKESLKSEDVLSSASKAEPEKPSEDTTAQVRPEGETAKVEDGLAEKKESVPSIAVQNDAGEEKPDDKGSKRSDSDEKFEVINAPKSTGTASQASTESKEEKASESTSNDAMSSATIAQSTEDKAAAEPSGVPGSLPAGDAPVAAPALEAQQQGPDSDSEDIQSVLSWATSVDSDLDVLADDMSCGSAWDSSSCGSSEDSVINLEDETIADDAWNAVCVVGLRVFAKCDTTIKVVKPRKEGSTLDVDDINKAISKDEPIASQSEVNKPSADGARPPLHERKSYNESMVGDQSLKLPVRGH